MGWDVDIVRLSVSDVFVYPYPYKVKSKEMFLSG